jgi:hypothetical protein
MSRFLRWDLFVVILIYVSILPILSQEPANIYDHAMTHYVSGSESLPADRTTTFSIDDAVAYCWIEIGRDLMGSHQVSWNWYSPNGKFYWTDSRTTQMPDPGGYFEWYRAWSPLLIRGYDPANMPGKWKVEVFLDGLYILREEFDIR